MQEPPPTANSDDPSMFDSNQFVRENIGRLRTRLLDLTTRNPLISFRHSSRSRRHIRVIDELPDILYTRLDAEPPSALRFKSLGDEPDIPDDEKTILFRRALDAAKLEDPEYIQKINESGDPGDKVLDRLERELRDRLRVQLGMPPRMFTGSLTPAEVARRRGLDPSFDLPASTTGTEVSPPTKHSDSAIQTLLFADAADRTLARMRDQVRLSVDQVGVNPIR
jgi:hypothetical protein